MGFGPASAGGPKKAIALHDGFVREVQNEAPRGGNMDGGDPCFGEDFDSSLTSGGGEAVDDGLGGVGDGEYSAVVFGFKEDIASLEPVDGFGGTEAGEGSDEGASAAWIAGGKFAWIEARVGDIAPSAAGDPDFGKKVGSFFEKDDLGIGIGLGCGDGGKKS